MEAPYIHHRASKVLGCGNASSVVYILTHPCRELRQQPMTTTAMRRTLLDPIGRSLEHSVRCRASCAAPAGKRFLQINATPSTPSPSIDLDALSSSPTTSSADSPGMLRSCVEEFFVLKADDVDRRTVRGARLTMLPSLRLIVCVPESVY